MKKTLFILLSAVFFSGCSMAEQNADILMDASQKKAGDLTKDIIANTEDRQKTTDEALNAEKEREKADDSSFVSNNRKLRFSVNKEWKCVELVSGSRIDCYPKARQAEEYDAGFEQPSVYFADLSLVFTDCGSNKYEISEIEAPPLKELKENAGIFYNFARNFGECGVYITSQNPEIDTNEELDNIIYNK